MRILFQVITVNFFAVYHSAGSSFTCHTGDTYCQNKYGEDSFCMENPSNPEQSVCTSTRDPCSCGRSASTSTLEPTTVGTSNFPDDGSRPRTCPIGDAQCRTIAGDVQSYCKFWTDNTCHRHPTIRCDCREGTLGTVRSRIDCSHGHEFCIANVNHSSFCKHWQIKPVCHGSGLQCTCHPTTTTRTPRTRRTTTTTTTMEEPIARTTFFSTSSTTESTWTVSTSRIQGFSTSKPATSTPSPSTTTAADSVTRDPISSSRTRPPVTSHPMTIAATTTLHTSTEVGCKTTIHPWTTEGQTSAPTTKITRRPHLTTTRRKSSSISTTTKRILSTGNPGTSVKSSSTSVTTSLTSQGTTAVALRLAAREKLQQRVLPRGL